MTSSRSRPLPGLDIVGRGLLLRPHCPYELKGVLFGHADPWSYWSRETKQEYEVPAGYGVDDSPPTPRGAALNQIQIEESWERFSKQRRLDTSAASGLGTFTVSASAHLGQELRSEEDAFYGVRSSFVALWCVYLEDPSRAFEPIDTSGLPTPFDPKHREAYDTFFRRYGTHFVKRAWVGGKADIMFSVAKSSSMTKAQIQAGLQASFGAIASAEVQAEQQRSREQLRSQSQCTVAGRGGDEFKLAALSSLDEARYNEWIRTIRDNPQTIEIEATGIWTLVEDPAAAKGLIEAYRTTSIFRPISSVFCFDDVIHFTRGRSYFTYDIETGVSGMPRPVAKLWPELDSLGFERIDAAFQFDGLVSATGERLDRKLFLFRRAQYLRIDIDKGTVDEGFPRQIHDDWPGITFEKIDAIMATAADSIYFFAGDEYIRFDGQRWQAAPEYPDLITRRWLGVTFDRIDAAIYWGGGKVYFFRDDEHIRYDIVTRRADPGYPKAVIGNYVEDWKFFD
ncbi:MAG: hemopexin repeat-containing protein [Myxococcota bacterium]